MLRLNDIVTCKKNIIIRVGVIISALEHCGKVKFRSTIFMLPWLSGLWCVVEVFIFGVVGI